SERQLGHADGGARVEPPLPAVEVDDQLGEAVDDGGDLGEAGGDVDHAEDAQPGGDPVEAAKLPLKAAEHRQSDQARRMDSLLQRHVAADLAARLGQRAVRIEWQVAGDRGAVAAYPHPGERVGHTRRAAERFGYGQTLLAQTLFDGHEPSFVPRTVGCALAARRSTPK